MIIESGRMTVEVKSAVCDLMNPEMADLIKCNPLGYG